MLILNLKTLGFVLLLWLVALVVLAVTLLQRRRLHKDDARPSDTSLLTVLEHAPFGMLVLSNKAYAYANAYARRMLRLHANKGALPDTDWAPLLNDDRANAREDTGTVTGRYRTITFASGHTARWWVIPWATRDFVFLLDITAQQRTEQAGRALINDLAHELRTPLATIMTHLEILGLSDVDDAMRQQSLTLSKDEAQRTTRLLNDMLELGRLETTPDLPRRPLDLPALVEEVVLQTIPRATEHKMTVSLEAESPLPLVLGNADRLRQVFLNLLDNALKYSREGDRVVVSLQRAPEGHIACSVCDTGPGIPAEHLPYVTRRFYRAASKEIEGSGLGLALVAEILRRHDSQLKLQSPVEGEIGTCARFSLPVAENDT